MSLRGQDGVRRLQTIDSKGPATGSIPATSTTIISLFSITYINSQKRLPRPKIVRHLINSMLTISCGDLVCIQMVGQFC